jgi:hypothetical protein
MAFACGVWLWELFRKLYMDGQPRTTARKHDLQSQLQKSPQGVSDDFILLFQDLHPASICIDSGNTRGTHPLWILGRLCASRQLGGSRRAETQRQVDRVRLQHTSVASISQVERTFCRRSSSSMKGVGTFHSLTARSKELVGDEPCWMGLAPGACVSK